MDLYLIKAGEANQNKDKFPNFGIPEHRIALSSNGIIQIVETSKYLKNYLVENNINIENGILWTSPFLRARETAAIINKYLRFDKIHEDYLLSGQRQGLFSGKSDGRNKLIYEDEFNFYKNYCDNNGEFYAKLPQGDSPMDVAVRTRLFLSTIPNNNPIFIVSHDTTIKTIVMNTFNLSPEWFNNEPDMENGSIRLIGEKDEFIYGGYVKKL